MSKELAVVTPNMGENASQFITAAPTPLLMQNDHVKTSLLNDDCSSMLMLSAYNVQKLLFVSYGLLRTTPCTFFLRSCADTAPPHNRQSPGGSTAVFHPDNATCFKVTDVTATERDSEQDSKEYRTGHGSIPRENNNGTT